MDEAELEKNFERNQWQKISRESKCKTKFRHSYTPQQFAASGLSIRDCEQDNLILHLLNAPNLGITIPSRSATLLEMMIANAMKKIAK